MELPGGLGGNDAPDGESLPELLRSWRNRAYPREVSETAAPRRRRSGLTQRELARLAGVSERWYGNLERGEPAEYSEGFLDRLSSALGLGEAERSALYLRAIGRPPTSAVAPGSAAAAGMDLTLQQFLDNQAPNPAFVTDLAWNVIGWNDPLREWFPWAAQQGNQMLWALLAPQARKQLVDWEGSWARPYLGQIRYARAQHPDDEALASLEREILARSAEARKMWNLREVHEHADGDLRRLRLPCHRGREVSVRIVALRLMRSDRLRVNVLMESGRAVGA
ncbi:helix-turn-helix transcriptional regulator [Streptomyces sp. NPDC060035]|uniref:helix-turn-helix transcriptional regulator n=1 Tax=Streptomyces sp. NPDC060035 TaxID=3347044 RepID=UPI0036B39037